MIWVLWIVLGLVVFLVTLGDWVMGSAFMDPWTMESEVVMNARNSGRITMIFGALVCGRLADVYSRPLASVVGLLFFTLGCIICAAASGPVTFAAGTIIYMIGSAGLSLLVTTFIADHTSLRWRGLALSWTYFMPIIVMWIVNPLIVHVSWRWTYGMFAVMVPVLSIPALVVLFSAASGYREEDNQPPWSEKIKNGIARMDLVGIILFTAGFGLIDYNTDVWYRETGTAPSPRQIAMLVVGFILLLPVFTIWELFFASAPFMPKRILTNRGAICAIIAVFLYRLASVSSSRVLINFSSFGSWTPYDLGLLISSWSMAYSSFAPFVGAAFLLTRRYKPHVLGGNGISILGAGLGVHAARLARRPNTPPSRALLFAMQVLKGLGGVVIELGLMVGAQASVTHNDLVTVIVLMTIWPTFGVSLSSALNRAVLGRADADSPKFITLYALAVGLSFLCLIASLFMPNYVLKSEHNVLEDPMEQVGEDTTSNIDRRALSP
ncbi:Siderophore iron transporter 3 [Ceratobasidium theobromae]|uniref:Siderophore iron transporter 3 n=1 Tax=Ceratobasidium theobromae TaxID=1582974 RepID=A0A5N5QIM8_9AGAM|nr:Siderophore iron transporter 3 [Ceratobasidium theobromae]